MGSGTRTFGRGSWGKCLIWVLMYGSEGGVSSSILFEMQNVIYTRKKETLSSYLP